MGVKINVNVIIMLIFPQGLWTSSLSIIYNVIVIDLLNSDIVNV